MGVDTMPPRKMASGMVRIAAITAMRRMFCRSE